MLLGSVLGGQNVVIWWVLDCFLECEVFLCFLLDMYKRCRFPGSEKLLVVMLILEGLNVAISFVLAMFLESHVFRRCALERPWSVLGGLLGWFWTSGMLLGSVLGGQIVVISLVLEGFL